jgi:hypothetical protein
MAVRDQRAGSALLRAGVGRSVAQPNGPGTDAPVRCATRRHGNRGRDRAARQARAAPGDALAETQIVRAAHVLARLGSSGRRGSARAWLLLARWTARFWNREQPRTGANRGGSHRARKHRHFRFARTFTGAFLSPLTVTTALAVTWREWVLFVRPTSSSLG